MYSRVSVSVSVSVSVCVCVCTCKRALTAANACQAYPAEYPKQEEDGSWQPDPGTGLGPKACIYMYAGPECGRGAIEGANYALAGTNSQKYPQKYQKYPQKFPPYRKYPQRRPVSKYLFTSKDLFTSKYSFVPSIPKVPSKETYVYSKGDL